MSLCVILHCPQIHSNRRSCLDGLVSLSLDSRSLQHVLDRTVPALFAVPAFASALSQNFAKSPPPSTPLSPSTTATDVDMTNVLAVDNTAKAKAMDTSDDGKQKMESRVDVNIPSSHTALHSAPSHRTLPSVLAAVAAMSACPAVFESGLPQLLAIVHAQFDAAVGGGVESVNALNKIHAVLACISGIVARLEMPIAAKETDLDRDTESESGMDVDFEPTGKDEAKDRKVSVKAKPTPTSKATRSSPAVLSFPPTLLSSLVRGSLLLSRHAPSAVLDARVVDESVRILATIARSADAKCGVMLCPVA